MRLKWWEPLLVGAVALPIVAGSLATKPFETRSPPPLRAASAHDELELGLRALDAGRPNDALVHWQRLMVLEPAWSVSHNNVGTALMKLRRPREARPHFLRAIELAPDQELPRNNLAWCERELAQEAAGGRAAP